MTKALIIKAQWLDKIFNHGKTWEMRSARTKTRGKIQLIESGTGMIVGECEITGYHEVKKEDFEKTIIHHKVDDFLLLEKWKWAWHISNVIKYNKPIHYKHPQGAVIWVNL